MSFDGSFFLESALERFLSRHPNLRSVPNLAALSHKGGALTADELVATIADPFLHPSYTISIMGCFRPLARRIVSRAVSKLRKVPSLESESEGSEEEFGEDDVYVVDFYVGRGRGLRLHELSSLAFCRALDLAPFLLSCIVSYFRFSPPPFRRLLPVRSASQFTEKVIFQLLDVVRVSYRFLLMNSKVFTELWDWSCFLGLVDQMADLHLSDNMPSLNNILDIRWCMVQILSVALRISDRSTSSFGMGADEAFTCLLRWEEFCQDTSLEKAGWYFQTTEVNKGGCLNEVVNFSQCIESFENDSSNSNKVESERGNCRSNFSCNLKFSRSPFFLTSTVKKSFEMVLMAVSQRWPVLLHGPAGAGKTALINRLAEMSRNHVLFIHMDEQLDSKTLVGSYICSERPGEFRWQPGSLTQAILNGLWVVFEDIDKAPNEVQFLILPLLEGSNSFATGHGEVIRVGESFRLFATISTSKREICHGIEGALELPLKRKIPAAKILLEAKRRMSSASGENFSTLMSRSAYVVRDQGSTLLDHPPSGSTEMDIEFVRTYVRRRRRLTIGDQMSDHIITS